MKWIKYPSVAFAAAIVTSVTFAQDQQEKLLKDREEKSQEIIIRKKGDKTDKMTIVVDGDKVTINGQPLDEYKNGDVTILRRDRPLAMAEPRTRGFERINPPDNMEGFNYPMPGNENKTMLGVMTQKADNGAKVTDVTKESGAEKAGLKKDDVITKVGNKPIGSPQDLAKAISSYKPNDKADITFKRDGKENKTTATLGENKLQSYSYNFNKDFNFNMPRDLMSHMDNFDFNLNHKPRIGLQIQDIEEGKGVKVKDVDEDSPAAKAGIKEGDVITGLNGKDVAGVDELRSAIKDLKEGDAVKLSYKRDGKNQTAEIKIPKRLKSADL